MKTVKDDLVLEELIEETYECLQHGAKLNNMSSILERGLIPGGGAKTRMHTFFAIYHPGDPRLTAGMRFESEICVYVDMKQAIEIDKVCFRRTLAGAVVTRDLIRPQFITRSVETANPSNILYDREVAFNRRKVGGDGGNSSEDEGPDEPPPRSGGPEEEPPRSGGAGSSQGEWKDWGGQREEWWEGSDWWSSWEGWQHSDQPYHGSAEGTAEPEGPEEEEEEEENPWGSYHPDYLVCETCAAEILRGCRFCPRCWAFAPGHGLEFAADSGVPARLLEKYGVKPGWILDNARRWRTTAGKATRLMAKANKRARRMGYADAEARLRADAVFAWNAATRMAGRYPAAFAAIAAQLCFGADATARDDAVVVAEARGSNLGLVSRGSNLGLIVPPAPNYQTVLFVGLPTLLCIAALCFLMGCCTGSVCSPLALARCCARRCMRALAAFIAPPGSLGQCVKRRRNVGVMSPCTYTWDSPDPRFKAGNQGFRRAGEVSVEEVD